MAEVPKEALKEQKQAKGPVVMQAADPWWAWDQQAQAWGWARDPPVSQKTGGDPNSPKKLRKKVGVHWYHYHSEVVEPAGCSRRGIQGGAGRSQQGVKCIQ